MSSERPLEYTEILVFIKMSQEECLRGKDM